ncbi:hypothetical protein SEA_RYADEL_104 [Mycobacterium phage Ryadel]|uniref:Uncharacterized protein n=1 Tax=Mycobacterium phage Ryadel TaxID=2283292 RepID=A0A345MF70_9CAUD|nr:hypothetical protein KNU03_gp104 [Mycobacterium phage Ryadel]AXH69201.1 hypothetical protein SEA_RYADEL_104 [Mycobacterium phage Ryadel]
MSDVVARAKAALEGVTEGPWETRVHAMPGATVDEWYVREITHTFDPSMHRLNVLKVRGATHAARQCCWPPTVADAEFIASARSLVPELIAEVELKSAQLAEWRAQYDAINAENERLRAQEARIRELCEDPSRGPLYPYKILAALEGEEV